MSHSKRSLYRITAVPALLLTLLLSACARYRPMNSVPLPIMMPAKFSANQGKRTLGPFWKEFKDPRLDRLVSTCLSDNLDLKTALARLAQSGALQTQVRSSRRPSLNASVGAARSRTVFEMPGMGRGPVQFYRSQYDLSAAASYEVDVFNKLGRRISAARLDTLAARADCDTLALTLAATVADTWFSLLEQRAQLKLLASQLKTGETFLELIELRLGQGAASALDVYQQKQQLAATRSQIPLVKAAEKLLEHRLALLTGKAPCFVDLFSGNAKLPLLPPFPSTGLPIELLDRRPDIRSARFRLLSSDRRAGAARADLLPDLNLSLSTGYQSYELSQLLNSWTWKLGGQLLAPILDGGRRKAEIRRTEAVIDERLHVYGAVVLKAVVEVEDALARERFQLEYIEQLKTHVELAKATLEEARARYLNGLSDYLPVLTALQSLQQLERNMLSAKRQVLSYRVALYRALGGGCHTVSARNTN